MSKHRKARRPVITAAAIVPVSAMAVIAGAGHAAAAPTTSQPGVTAPTTSQPGVTTPTTSQPGVTGARTNTTQWQYLPGFDPGEFRDVETVKEDDFRGPRHTVQTVPVAPAAPAADSTGGTQQASMNSAPIEYQQIVVEKPALVTEGGLVKPIQADDGTVRLGIFTAAKPEWIPQHLADQVNNTSAVLEARGATAFNSLGIPTTRSQRVAAGAAGGILIGGGVTGAVTGTVTGAVGSAVGAPIGAVVVGVPAAVVGAVAGALIGGTIGGVAAGAAGAILLPGVGVIPGGVAGTAGGALVGAAVGAAVVGAGGAAVGTAAGAATGGAIGGAVGGTAGAVVGGTVGGVIGTALGAGQGMGEAQESEGYNKDALVAQTRHTVAHIETTPAGAAVTDGFRAASDAYQGALDNGRTALESSAPGTAVLAGLDGLDNAVKNLVNPGHDAADAIGIGVHFPVAGTAPGEVIPAAETVNVDVVAA